MADARRTTAVVRLRSRSSVLLLVTSIVGLVGFSWPLFLHGSSSVAQAHSADAPWIFIAVLPLLLAVVLSALAEGSLDAKAIALLFVKRAASGQVIVRRCEYPHLHLNWPRRDCFAVSQSSTCSLPSANRRSVAASSFACQAGDSNSTSGRLNSSQSVSISLSFSLRGI